VRTSLAIGPTNPRACIERLRHRLALCVFNISHGVEHTFRTFRDSFTITTLAVTFFGLAPQRDSPNLASKGLLRVQHFNFGNRGVSFSLDLDTYVTNLLLILGK